MDNIKTRIIPEVHANFSLPTGASTNRLNGVKIDVSNKTLFYTIDNFEDVGFYVFLEEIDLIDAVKWLKHYAEINGKCKTETDLVKRIAEGCAGDNGLLRVEFYYLESFKILGEPSFEIEEGHFADTRSIDSFFSYCIENEESYTSSEAYNKISAALYYYIVEEYLSNITDAEVGLSFSINPGTVPSSNPFIFCIEANDFSKNIWVYIEEYGDNIVECGTHITVPLSLLDIT